MPTEHLIHVVKGGDAGGVQQAAQRGGHDGARVSVIQHHADGGHRGAPQQHEHVALQPRRACRVAGSAVFEHCGARPSWQWCASLHRGCPMRITVGDHSVMDGHVHCCGWRCKVWYKGCVTLGSVKLTFKRRFDHDAPRLPRIPLQLSPEHRRHLLHVTLWCHAHILGLRC